MAAAEAAAVVVLAAVVQVDLVDTDQDLEQDLVGMLIDKNMPH